MVLFSGFPIHFWNANVSLTSNKTVCEEKARYLKWEHRDGKRNRRLFSEIQSSTYCMLLYKVSKYFVPFRGENNSTGMNYNMIID